MKLNASSLDQISKCPGSYAAQQGIAYIPSPAAEEGTLMHAVMEKKTPIDVLTREQKRIIAMCHGIGADLLNTHVPGCKNFRREWYSRVTVGDGTVVASKVDFAAWAAKGLAIDWKFGRASDQEASESLQLATYAIAVAREYDVDSVVVAIVQPYAERERRVTVSEYTKDDIGAAEEELARIAASIVPDAPRIPGASQCRYCKALGTSRCPESSERALELVQVQQSQLMPTGAELGRWLEMRSVLVPFLETLKAHAVQQILDGQEVPGWKVSLGNNIRKIPDPNAAWERMSAIIDPNDFVAACSVGVGKLEDAYAAKTGKRGKELLESFEAAMGPAMIHERNAPTLKRA